ncbi:MAG: DNA polymerase IV [Planctomycetota bacterium]|nr:DNA polymerase IV [Planctomycetota bacterium]MDA1137075.1 DNA polymerase IV [Planctomycetota bacterium]
MTTRRTIIHADMDAFYASVEQRDNPELRGKPVIVGGSPESRGVVSAASYEAREFGVHSAMPTAHAKRRCPHGIFLPVRMEKYQEVSQQIRRVFEQFTPLVEPLSLDEAFMDVTGSLRLFGSPREIAQKIKQQVKEQTDLIVSTGIAPNKFLAKLASDLSKPDGLLEITEAEKLEFLGKLEVNRLWGVGKKTAKVLEEFGIRTVEQLRRVPVEILKRRIGIVAEHLAQLANGEDSRHVVPDHEAKSIGSECTFANDITSMEQLEPVSLAHSEDVSARLRSCGLTAKTVTLKVKFADFTLTTRSSTLDTATDRTDVIAATAEELLHNHNQIAGRSVRLLGVSISQLSPRGERQLSLFDSKEDTRRRELDRAVDQIRKQMGHDKIKRGRLL